MSLQTCWLLGSLTTVVDRVTKWANEYAAVETHSQTDSFRQGGEGRGTLSMDLFDAYCGELVTSLRTGGFSRGKH